MALMCFDHFCPERLVYFGRLKTVNISKLSDRFQSSDLHDALSAQQMLQPIC